MGGGAEDRHCGSDGEEVEQVCEEGGAPDRGIVSEGERGEMEVEEADTYHDPDVLIRVAELARGVAWVALVVYVLIWVGQVVSYISSVRSSSSVSGAGLGEIGAFILSTGGILISGVWYFIVLRFISEVSYILLDIEENTRRGEGSGEG